MTDFRDTWTDQCEAAEDIRERFGIEKAIGYLVGEKFIEPYESWTCTPSTTSKR